MAHPVSGKALVLILAATLAGCQLLPRGEASRPARGDARPAAAAATSTTAADRQCFADLARIGARFTPAPDRRGADGCIVTGAVDLESVPADGGRIVVTNAAPLRCETARALAGWSRYGVERSARDFLGSGLVRIETMGSYACRNVAGTSRRSGHARAAALDISAFVLEDGRRIAVVDDWFAGTDSERRFLRRIHESACKRFGTTLGPDYNTAHRDHFHVETDGGGFCR